MGCASPCFVGYAWSSSEFAASPFNQTPIKETQCGYFRFIFTLSSINVKLFWASNYVRSIFCPQLRTSLKSCPHSVTAKERCWSRLHVKRSSPVAANMLRRLRCVQLSHLEVVQLHAMMFIIRGRDAITCTHVYRHCSHGGGGSVPVISRTGYNVVKPWLQVHVQFRRATTTTVCESLRRLWHRRVRFSRLSNSVRVCSWYCMFPCMFIVYLLHTSF